VLLHTHNLSAADITPTGPDNRLLKGDVLAHLGSIPKTYPKEASERFEKASHLDLSNVTPAAPKQDKKVEPVAVEEPPMEQFLNVSLPIDLKPLLKLQHKLQETLGHAPDLSELISRAVDLSNTGLPSSSRPPSTDQLFDELVGIPSFSSAMSNGTFAPLINAAEPEPVKVPQIDLFDQLVGSVTSKPKALSNTTSVLSGAVNDFSLAVAEVDKKRATVFLQRMKSVLEVEPGKLVL